MKYYARVGTNEYVVDIEADGIYVNGELATVDMKQRAASSSTACSIMGAATSC